MSGSLNGVIDAHVHWWSIQRTDYAWLTPASPSLYRDFGPADLEPQLKNREVDGVILVQAAATEEETQFLLDLARPRPYVQGVVGWVDLQNPEKLRTMARSNLLVGIRPMLQDIEDPRWILKDSLSASIQMIEEFDLTFDALITVRHLPYLAEFVARYPKLRVIIDHAAKPTIETKPAAHWKAQLSTLAAARNVACKLSGFAIPASATASTTLLNPYAAAIFELFGPDRVLWGSDWPVLTEHMQYSEWFDLATQLTETHAPGNLQKVFGGNARRWYGIGLRSERSGT